MAYFDEIKVKDKVWDFLYGEGKVYEIEDGCEEETIIKVKFKSGLRESYNLDGRKFTCTTCNQTLFWDEIKFEIPKKSEKIKLKEYKYFINFIDFKIIDHQHPYENFERHFIWKRNGFFRDDIYTAKKTLNYIKKFSKLLALRDQECPNSRGYEFKYDKENYYIEFNHLFNRYETRKITYDNQFEKIGIIYFATQKDAQKICDILNSSRFNLEEE